MSEVITINLSSFSLDFIKTHLKLEVENTSLNDLAKSLPTYLSFCREENTLKKYQSSYKYWVSWSKSFNVSTLPAKPTTIALFILNAIQSDWQLCKIEGVYYAIRFFHLLAGHENPCNHSVVTNMLEASKRMIRHKKNRKQPITLEHLQLLFTKLSKVKNMYSMRTMTICLLGYAGFMRYSEIAGLRRCDVHFYDTYMKLFIEKSKTDVYREGSWIYISKTDSELCPVKNLMLYLEATKITESSEEFIFRAITVTKVNEKGTLRKGKSLSYTRMREILLEELEGVGLEKNKFGLHSLRSGGATAAANGGVADRLFKRHGRWKSETAKDGYVEDNLESLLSVSKSLGL